MIGEAAAFADKAHKGAFRKGTKDSVHHASHGDGSDCVRLTDDEEIIAAALLHDVMEDAGVTREELEDAFGSRVADLVVDESEDKSRSWQERKTRTVRHLCTASWEIKILALGDKLSNMRCTARDYLVVGDAIWQRFNEKDKRKHARYYWG